MNPISYDINGFNTDKNEMNEVTRMRKCGVLCPIFSLPSPYGIGTMGKSAYEFEDLLKKAGQS